MRIEQNSFIYPFLPLTLILMQFMYINSGDMPLYMNIPLQLMSKWF
jgi:hypothetical protein